MAFKKKLKLENGTTVTRADDLVLVYLRGEQSFEADATSAALSDFTVFEAEGVQAAPDQKTARTSEVNQSVLHRFCKRRSGAVTEVSTLHASLGESTASVSAVYYSDKDDLRTYFSPIAHVLVVDPEGSADRQVVERIFKERGLTINETKSRYLSGKFYVTIDDGQETAYELREKLLRHRAIKQVYFEKVPLLSPTCALPNDPLFPLQWNLGRIEWHLDYQGCDVTTVIAVIDQGCDLAHPDLSFASPGLNLGTMLPDGSPTGPHGTACAGIAAAVTGNSQGVAGVAGRAKILPLAVTTWSDVEIANGIHYATSFGADVISMSFGVYDSWNFWNYDLIDPEIVFATNHSVFMCAASGNENLSTLNRYPGKHPLVLCVGGSNRDDVRKSVGDTSIESWWGACYGLEFYEGNRVGVDVVAPCLEIPTTDILGGSGYNPGDYYNRFNGTSSATPQVAGMAALIKSAFPSAGNSIVKKIIEETADKIGGYAYAHWPEFPNSPWTQEVGHGRINVRRAMERVRHYVCAQPCCCEVNGHPVAFSVSGRAHISQGGDVHLKNFSNIVLNSGMGWSNDVFSTPERGLYYFDWNFVKDSFYHGGTQDDVSIYLQVNNADNFGFAWSGQGAGRRGTGASSVILALNQGDKVRAMVHSDHGKKRHVSVFGLNGHKLAS